MVQLFFSLFFLPSAAYAAAMTLQAPNFRRADLAVSTVTSWAPPATVTITKTVNPSDVTSWIVYATTYVYPYTQTTTITTGCVSYSYIQVSNPAPATTKTSSSVSRTTVTATSTTSVTVTEARTDHPRVTRFSITLKTVSRTTGRTEYSTICTNTLVWSYYVPTTSTIYRTEASVYTRTSKTEVCMIDKTRLVTIPGVTLTYDPYMPALSRFSGNLTLYTSHERSYSYEYVTITTDTAVNTEVICNNPSSSETSTYYTLTVTAGTTTIYASQTGCAAASTSATPVQTSVETSAVITAAPSSPLVDPQGGNDVDGGNANAGDVDVGINHPVKARQEQSSSLETRTPARVYTTTYTTAILVNGTAVESHMATAVVDVFTQTFITIYMVGATVTTTETKYSTTPCSLPTPG